MSSVYLSKNDMVTAALRELIIRGEIQPGTPLRQRDLAERFDVSPTPVREALRRLEVEGLVSYDVHRGVTVIEADSGSLTENYQIRAALESLAAGLAATKVTPADVDEIEAINEQMALRATQGEEIRRLNRTFHFRIYECSGSPLLLSLMRLLWQAFPDGPPVVHPKRESVRQHGEVVEALRAGDAEAASAAARRHILAAVPYLEKKAAAS